LRGTKRVLKDAQAAFDLVTVPGALEIPAAIMIGLHAAAAREQPYDGVVALGCVIRGETSHYDIVAGESARAIMELTLQGYAIGNGILTVENEDQAIVRADPAQGDKGGHAALAALRLYDLREQYAP